MPPPVTVVINCAGEGRRLGLGKTKALADILGRPLIAWQLDMLEDVRDVRMVVGFNAAEAIEVANNYRRDLIFAFNHDYGNTGTAASLALGAKHVAGDVISLDADLLVHPVDFSRILNHAGPVLGVSEVTTDNPVYVRVEPDESGQARGVEFNRTGPGMEWTGLVRLPAQQIRMMDALGNARNHVFEMLKPLLPLPALQVRTREIDTPDDYERAVAWLSNELAPAALTRKAS